MTNLIGKKIGSYEIKALAGQGGMAEVYKGYHASVDRYVALKVLSRASTVDLDFAARFQQEARLLAKLDHPYILPIFDYGQAEGIIYIVMPFVESGTLSDLINSSRLDLAQIQRIISQIGDALDYAHSQGVVHRDIKPSNVLIDERGNCRLTDFGIAKLNQASVKLTQTGASLGTPAYMSPEQIEGDTLDGRTDIYSLGIMLYQMATGRLPYNANTPARIYVMHLRDPLPPPRTVNPALPPAVEAVILKSLEKQREDRYATAAEMVQALQAAISGTTPYQPAAIEETQIEVDPDATLSPARPAAFTPQSQAVESKSQAESKRGMIIGLIAVVVVVGLALAALTLGGGASTEAETATTPTDSAAAVPSPAPTMLVAVATLTSTPEPTAVPTSKPTIAPTDAPAPTEAADESSAPTVVTGIVAVDTLNVRGGPGQAYESVTQLQKGEAVHILSRASAAGEEWWQAESPAGEWSGWLLAEHIRLDTDALPEVTPPPSPTPGPTATPTVEVLPAVIAPWGITGPVDLAAGGEHNFDFHKDDPTETEMNFFIFGAHGEIEIFIYNDFDMSTHTGIGNEEFLDRDGDAATREFRWVAGQIDPMTNYVVKVINKGTTAIRYCINTVKDGICTP